MNYLEVKFVDLEKIYMFKFLVGVFRSLYLLKFETDLTDTLPDIRYYPKILCCTIPTPSLTLRSRSQTSRFYVRVFGKSFQKAIFPEPMDVTSS